MRARGFTLVELIIVIVLTGIIASVIAVFIPGPIQAYQAQARRAELTDAAELALRRIARDIRRAVPNSVRVASGGLAIEMLNAQDGGRYRLGPGPGVASQDKRLRFNNTDAEFNIVGPFTAVSSTTHRLVIYNLGIGGANIYANDPVVTPPGTSITIAPDSVANEMHVTLSPAHQFALQSPRQRIFLVDEAISYVCSPGGGTLRRNAGYAYGAVQPTDPAVGAMVVSLVSACSFSYDPGTATRSALVTLRIALTSEGETVSLLHQVHVDNAP